MMLAGKLLLFLASIIQCMAEADLKSYENRHFTCHSPIYSTILSSVRNRNYPMNHSKHNMIDIVHASWHRPLASDICREFYDHILRTVHKFFRI